MHPALELAATAAIFGRVTQCLQPIAVGEGPLLPACSKLTYWTNTLVLACLFTCSAPSGPSVAVAALAFCMSLSFWLTVLLFGRRAVCAHPFPQGIDDDLWDHLFIPLVGATILLSKHRRPLAVAVRREAFATFLVLIGAWLMLCQGRPPYDFFQRHAHGTLRTVAYVWALCAMGYFVIEAFQ